MPGHLAPGPMRNLLGTVIGKYRLTEQLGGSSAGEVYKGVQVGLDREVAVRVLHPEQAGDSLTMARFRQESRATAQLSHPHILTIYDSGKHEDLRYYVMEVAPTTLASRLEGGQTLPVEEALRIAEEIAKALEYVHERQVYHRLLVPSNVRFDLRGNAVLGGFGAEPADVYPRLEAASDLGYASPEIMLGEKVGPSTDVYQLGVLLYECLGGRRPYPGRPPFVAGGSGYEKAITPLPRLREEVTRELDALVLSCLRADPAERPADVATLRKGITKMRRKVEVRNLSRQVAGQATPRGVATDRIPTRAIEGATLDAALGQGGPAFTQSESVVKAVRLLTGGHGDLRRRETRIRLAAVAGPFLVLVVVGGLWLAGLLGSPELEVLESLHEVEAQAVTVSWKSNRPCYGFLELVADGADASARRTRPTESKQTVFRQTIPDLAAGTGYRYRIGLSHSPDGGGAAFSPVREVRTEQALEVHDVRALATEARAVVIRWKTNRVADTRVRLWRGASPARVVEDLEATQELEHRLRIEALEPGTTYQYQVISRDAVDRDRVAESRPDTFSTPTSEDTDDPQRRLIEGYVRKARSLSAPELAKLEAALGDLVARDADLDAEQKVLLSLTETGSPESFFRRRQLAERWARGRQRDGGALPPPPSWSPKPDLIETLAYLKDFYEVGSKPRAYGRLDECLRLLAGLEGIPEPDGIR